MVRPDGVYSTEPSNQNVEQSGGTEIDIVSHKAKKEMTMCNEEKLKQTAIEIAASLGNSYAGTCISSEDQQKYPIPSWLVRVHRDQRLMRCVLTRVGVSKKCEENVEYRDKVCYEELDDE